MSKYQNAFDDMDGVSSFKKMDKEGSELTVRIPDFQFDGLPKYFAANAFISHYMAVLSSTFPAGENFFIHAVREGSKKLPVNHPLHPTLQSFIGQEAHHANHHDKFNEVLESLGYGLLEKSKKEQAKFVKLGQDMPLKKSLAITCALEHFTAILCEYFLETKHLTNKTHIKAMPIWAWHCIEESEHKSVAFDLYKELYPDANSEKIRKKAMFYTTFGFILWFNKTFFLSLKRDFKAFLKPSTWLGISQIILMYTRLLPRYLAYYKTSFHPSEQGRDDVIAFWKAKLSL